MIIKIPRHVQKSFDCKIPDLAVLEVHLYGVMIKTPKIAQEERSIYCALDCKRFWSNTFFVTVC